VSVAVSGACTDAPIVSPTIPIEGGQAQNQAPALDDGLRAYALKQPDAEVEVQLELRQPMSLQQITALVQRHGLTTVGLNHGFRHGTQVQVGGYDIPANGAGTDWTVDYVKSTADFLRMSIDRAESAAAAEADPGERRSLQTLAETFRARMTGLEAGAPTIYSIRVRGRASVLAGLWRQERLVRSAAMQLPRFQYRRPRQPAALQPDLQGRGLVVDCVIETDGCTPYVPPEPPPEPEPLEVVVPLYDYVLYEGFLPPREADPWNDDSYYDDNSVNNFRWAPSHGKSWVDRDNASKYSYQYISWRFPGLEGLIQSCGSSSTSCAYSIEHEVHQDENSPRQMYGKGFYVNSSGRNRGAIWESNFPAAYLDSQFGDGLFAGKPGVQNTAVGTNQPNLLKYGTTYYNWIRFNQVQGSGMGHIQVAVQLGDKAKRCQSDAWCTLNSLATVRVIPWRCNYRAPNSSWSNNAWVSWYYDGRGYKNENCSSTG